MTLDEIVGDQIDPLEPHKLLTDALESKRHDRRVAAVLDLAQWIGSMLVASIVADGDKWPVAIEIVAIAAILRVSLAACAGQANMTRRVEDWNDIIEALKDEIDNGSA